jgi:hypothetical protein
MPLFWLEGGFVANTIDSSEESETGQRVKELGEVTT